MELQGAAYDHVDGAIDEETGRAVGGRHGDGFDPPWAGQAVDEVGNGDGGFGVGGHDHELNSLLGGVDALDGRRQELGQRLDGVREGIDDVLRTSDALRAGFCTGLIAGGGRA